MLNYDLRFDDGILVLKPDGPLEAADFASLAYHVDNYLDRHGVLHGVMVKAHEFPGWHDFGALVAHLKFVRDHHRKIEKIALVSDSSVATAIPRIANHFIRAHIRHFDPVREDEAWAWLTMEVMRRPARHEHRIGI